MHFLLDWMCAQTITENSKCAVKAGELRWVLLEFPSHWVPGLLPLPSTNKHKSSFLRVTRQSVLGKVQWARRLPSNYPSNEQVYSKNEQDWRKKESWLDYKAISTIALACAGLVSQRLFSPFTTVLVLWVSWLACCLFTAPLNTKLVVIGLTTTPHYAKA